MASPIRRGTCDYCQRPVLWGTLQNGRSRTFDPEPKRIGQVAPADRFAYSRRYRAVVCLDGEPSPPALVHVPHYCAAYAEAKAMRGVERLIDVMDLPFLRGAQ
jgi:hypothetical protein